MMPDDRGWTESDDVALLLEAPAKIDVVACLAIFDVEAADGIEGPRIKGHVTSRNVRGNSMAGKNVARSARRLGHAGLNSVFGRRRDVAATDTRVVTADQRSDQVI